MLHVLFGRQQLGKTFTCFGLGTFCGRFEDILGLVADQDGALFLPQFVDVVTLPAEDPERHGLELFAEDGVAHLLTPDGERVFTGVGFVRGD